MLATAVNVQPQQLARIIPASQAGPAATGKVDQGRFWVGAALTASVAALASVIGMVVVNDLLHIPLMGVGVTSGAGPNLATFGIITAVVALLAALLYDGMRAFAPRPTTYFTALTALVTGLAVLLPFAAGGAVATALAAAGINLVVGILIMVLVPVAATNARVRS